MVKKARLYPSVDPDIGIKAKWLDDHGIEWCKDYNSAVGPAPGYGFVKPDIVATFVDESDLSAFIMLFGKIAFDASQENTPPTKLDVDKSMFYKYNAFAYQWIDPHSPAGILEKLRRRTSGDITPKGTYRSQPFIDWILENKIEAFMPDACTINFQHEEDLTLFKLKFGL